VLSAVVLAAVLTAAAVLVADLHRSSAPAEPGAISGPYASLLASSVDLGRAQTDRVQLTAALRDDSRPDLLMGWAVRQNLSVRWRPGDSWAILEGAPAAVSGALDVDVHDYRGQRGQVFYASPQQPSVPQSLSMEVAGLGRILGYTPYRESKVWMLPLEVPDRGLTPSALLRTYNATRLHDKGYTGKGTTVVVFAFDGFEQADLDAFATSFSLPKFTPDVVGGMPPARRGEATMDLEAIHAIAPDAKTVLVNARPTVEGDGSYEKIAKLMEDTERTYPGAVWSFSIGWGCDKLITAPDLVPVRSALAAAQRSGTTAFDASGDLAGLDCKGGQEWSAPPGGNDVGLDAVASMPEMTDVGGTTVSTDAKGDWLAEQSWFDPALSQGTGGGVSALFERPEWQNSLNVPTGAGKRLTPDIAAVADPFTGMQIVFNRELNVGGGTSLSAPIWAGITALMNQYVVDHGGSLIGDLNPLLYHIAESTPLPAFRDIVLGGNAVANAGPGYDLVTGLGTPNVENLAQNILVIQNVVR
jgi:kumamolisin